MANERKTVKDYLLRGGIEGKHFVISGPHFREGVIYQITDLRQSDTHTFEVVFGPKGVPLSACLYDREATPEEIARAKRSLLEQKTTLSTLPKEEQDYIKRLRDSVGPGQASPL